MPCCAVLCYAVLGYAMLCYAMLWKELHGQVVTNRHIVVLGWTHKTLFVVADLAEMPPLSCLIWGYAMLC